MSKIAVITGTSSGIGEAIATMLLDQGWQVYGISRKKSAKFDSNRNFHQLICDLSSTEQIEQIIQKLPNQIDSLINNAGVWELVKIEDVTLEHINKMIDTNLRAPIYLTTLLLSRINTDRHIINISSILSRLGEPEYGIYASAKAGIDRFTTTLAKENANLHISAILPSATNTPGNRAVLGEDEDYSTYITPNQIASVAKDILNNKYKSGSLIVVNNQEYQYLWDERDKYTLVEI